VSLNATLLELIERGLAAKGEEGPRAELEASLAASTRELEEARARVEVAELRLQHASEREEHTQRTLRALAERSRTELGACPRCRKPVSGFDYLVHGCCPHCKKALTAFLTPRPQVGAPERDEYLALLGALGGLVGLAGAGVLEAAG
jgi:rubrerythrin